MKKKVLVIITLVVLLLVGCNKEVIHKNVDTPTEVEEKKEQQGQSNSASDNIETYNDETLKEIQYGKLSLEFSYYHIVSRMESKDNVTYECEIDKGKVLPEKRMTITIKEIKKQDFSSKESIISYLRDLSQKYEKIKIYNNITDDSGITGLYSITEGEMTYYIVSYRNAFYLIESDYNKLKIMLFKNRQKAQFEVNNKKIECANDFIADVNEIIPYKDNKIEYYITQGKNGRNYFAELTLDEEYQYNLTLKNDKDKDLLTLSGYTSNIKDVFYIKDINMDGYADIQVLKESGALNNNYDLYVWDDFVKNFIKVKYNDIISHFEVHDGYLLNWIKEDGESGVIQKLVWDKNTLIKKSEENYKAN